MASFGRYVLLALVTVKTGMSLSLPRFISMMASSPVKVTVFGGSGFVGSRVCKILLDKGAVVTSVSKSGRAPDWCAGQPWTREVKWCSADLLGSESALDAVVGKPDAVVSCVGLIGNDAAILQRGNGDANVAAFSSSKRGGNLKRSVFVSVSSEVSACKDKWLPSFFSGYFEGKRMAERAALSSVNGDATKVCIVKPTFIYGGDSFGLLPPRVNTAYGSGIEELLSSPVFCWLADNTPGMIKVALRPPSSVDAVAQACALAALGALAEDSATRRAVGTLDGTAAINESTGLPAARGLSDAVSWAKAGLLQAGTWAKEEIEKISKR